MIHTKDHKTMNMFDPFDFLGPKRRKLINDSWAKIFRDEILSDLPVHLIMPHYHASKGRSSKELYAMLGLMILQQMHDLTDEDAASQFAFNIQWHFALNITGSKDCDTYLPVRRTQTGACPKTIWNMRDILTEKNLYTPLFDSVTDKLAKVFTVDTDKQRYDSMHIFSNMRHLGRVGLFVKTIKKFLVNLKRHHINLYDGLEKELANRYMTKNGENLFSMVKPSESERTLKILGDNLFSLIERFKQNKCVATMSSYKLLTQLLKNQCVVEEDINGEVKKVLIKPNKDIPSDPDAGYSGHKGKGYQVQVAETYNDANDNKEEKKTLSLITHVNVEPANKSDSNALLPIIKATKKKGLEPKEVLVDSLYGSDENCEKAKKLDVEVISPTMGKEPEKALTLSDFIFCKSGIVKACPEGKEPIKTKKNKKGKQSAVFKSEICLNCSSLKDCPVKPGKKGYKLSYDDKLVRLSRRRAYEKTDEFRDKYRFRAGVEATMSYYDRKTGVKRLRVRGLRAVSFSATLKAIGVNIFRAATFKNSKDYNKAAIKGLIASVSSIYQVVKVQVLPFRSINRYMKYQVCPYSMFISDFAA